MKKLSNLMLFSNFLCTLFYSMSYPYIYAETIKVVSRQYISIEQIISCIGIVVFGTVWNKYGDKLFKHYKQILVLEVIMDIILFGHVLITGNLKFYFLFNIIVYAVVTKNLSCARIKMKAKVNPTEQLRETYDNNSNSIYALATLFGTGIALLCNIPLNILFILALVGGVVDNFFDLYIFNKLQTIKRGCKNE